MISHYFHLIFYYPLYNALVFIIDHVPGGDIGIAVIIITIVVRLILFPLSKVATVTQLKMKEFEPELALIRTKYKDDKEEQAKQTLAFYKDNGLNPFSGVVLLLIQLPIILALAFIFTKGGLPKIDATILYSYIHVPAYVNTMFIGLLDISKRSIILGVLAGVTQFFQIRLSVPAYVAPKDKPKDGKANFSDDLAKNMNMQMRYVLPAFIFIISLGVSGAVALYWVTSNLFVIGQELYFRRNIKKAVK